ncbi:type II toxin-antitoxin system VapC family toxin [Frankia sp. R43]|uniref:type II toxin-antitoxin system VapC family toxin n=1 Tax=Frankia sp. R43 TaxID=269536 RepID=UPI0009FB5130|nr:type II toxin-antitoxin system VapC family toxin [Frankia sp. R43]
MNYLLDTNVIAELTTRPRPSPAVLAWARSVPAPDLFLSVVTIAEIGLDIAAVLDPGRRATFEQALNGVRHEYKDRIIAIGEAEALAYLTIQKKLKSAGTPIYSPDALIAATALANGWTLATRNIKHLVRAGAPTINPWDHQ